MKNKVKKGDRKSTSYHSKSRLKIGKKRDILNEFIYGELIEYTAH